MINRFDATWLPWFNIHRFGLIEWPPSRERVTSFVKR